MKPKYLSFFSIFISVYPKVAKIYLINISLALAARIRDNDETRNFHAELAAMYSYTDQHNTQGCS